MVKLDGQPFSGVTFNQGVFAGNRGHIYIQGVQQCKYAINVMARNRLWISIKTITDLEKRIQGAEICQQCAKTTSEKINKHKVGA